MIKFPHLVASFPRLDPSPPLPPVPKIKMTLPDFTKGDTIPEGAKHDWNLGATGARGWIFSEKMETSTARQIAITKVAEGSPAAGTLKPGDVILGVGDKPFAYDPRTEIWESTDSSRIPNRQREARSHSVAVPDRSNTSSFSSRSSVPTMPPPPTIAQNRRPSSNKVVRLSQSGCPLPATAPRTPLSVP